jgi:hypothetical protein
MDKERFEEISVKWSILSTFDAQKRLKLAVTISLELFKGTLSNFPQFCLTLANFGSIFFNEASRKLNNVRLGLD